MKLRTKSTKHRVYCAASPCQRELKAKSLKLKADGAASPRFNRCGFAAINRSKAALLALCSNLLVLSSPKGLV